MTRVGTGYVEIEPNFDAFDAKVRARLAALDGEFKRVGQSAGQGFTAGFSAGRSSRDLDVVSGKLGKVERDAKRAAKGFEGLVAAAGGGGGFRGAARGLDAFGGAAAGATATIGGFRIAVAGLIPVMVGFGGASIAAASSLGPLIGLAAAGGNAFAAAAQGMGVFQLATLGVADALKEQVGNAGKAAGAAISNASSQRLAARAVQSAQDGVRSAVQALSDAEKEQAKAVNALEPAYSAARMKLTDLRAALQDAGLSLEGARLAATDAQRALADLLRGPDPRVLADAHRQVRDALRSEDDAAQGLADAYKALNDLMQPPDVLSVADAQDAVADAVRNEERARLSLNDQIQKTGEILSNQPKPTSDIDKAKARLDLADAENAIGDATRASEHARQSLAKLESGPDQSAVDAARRRVADAEFAVQKATEGTAAAKTDLAKLETPASSQELAKARLDVSQAESAVWNAERETGRVQRELTDAEARGIRNSKDVVAAREAIAKANRDVADAARNVRQAEQSLSDAQLSAKESMDKAGVSAASLNEKFNKLPPAAQAFVRALQAMKPRLDELRQTAAGGFFPGATEGLQAAAKNFDSVNRVVERTAVVLGDAARKSGELVGSPAFGRDLETIGGRNAKVLDTLGEALRHVVSALRYVALAAGPLTQHLADLVLGWSKTAASSAKAGEETGRLAGFFQKTEDITRRLLSVLGHLGSGLLGVGKAGKETGDSIWASVDRAAKRFDEWANSAKGQKALREFFKESKDLAAALIPVLVGVGKGIAFVSLKSGALSAILRLLGPYADEATVAFIAYKVATLALAAASNLATLATKAWAAGQWLLNAALTANPIGVVVVAIAALAAGIIYAYTHSETFRGIVDALGNAFKDVFGWLRDNWPLVLGILTGPIGLAVVEIVKHWDDIKSTFTNGLRAVIDAITGAASWFVDAGKNMVRWIVDGIKSLNGALVDAAGWVKNRIVDAIEATADAFKAAGSWVLNRIIDGFRVVTDLLGSVGGWLKNRVEEAIHAEIDGIKAVGGWVLNRLVDGFTTVTDALSSVGGWIKNRLGDIFGGVKDDLVGIGKSVLGWIVDGMKAGLNDLIDFVNEVLDVIGKIPGVPDIHPIKHVKLAEGGVNAMARGGAFARTGGVVNRPIVMMGEEAPRFAEFVIPTNPAYRDRAQGLLAQAANAIGMAGGGVFGAVKDLIGKGASSLLGALPDTGRIPDWLKGTGKWILEHIADWVAGAFKSTVSAITGGGGGGGGTSGANQALGKRMMLAAGFASSEWPSLKALWQGESGWNENAVNPSSGAGGIPQALPASKMGAGWQGNAAQQIAWGLGYIKGTYGTPSNALAKWQARSPHWYAMGGLVPAYAGSFAGGGVVPGPVGAPRLIEAHGGEIVSDPRSGPLVHVDQLIVADRSDVNTVAARLAWLMEQA